MDSKSSTATGQGVFVVSDVNAKYELVNVSTVPAYLQACDINFTVSNSYFSSVLVSLVFIKLSP